MAGVCGDPRAGWYIEKHGQSSWEVDALNPETLAAVIEDHLQVYIDMDKYEKWKIAEAEVLTKYRTAFNELEEE